MIQKRNTLGFTIIEVIIVLAVAGLILTIVLMSVGSLQRMSRNNERKQDAAFISSERLTYDLNGITTFPTSAVQSTCAAGPGGSFSALCSYLVKYMSYYQPANIIIVNNGTSAPTTIPTPTTDTVISSTFLRCNANNNGAVIGSMMTDSVVLFAIEDGSGNQVVRCLYAQVMAGT